MLLQTTEEHLLIKTTEGASYSNSRKRYFSPLYCFIRFHIESNLNFDNESRHSLARHEYLQGGQQ